MVWRRRSIDVSSLNGRRDLHCYIRHVDVDGSDASKISALPNQIAIDVLPSESFPVRLGLSRQELSRNAT